MFYIQERRLKEIMTLIVIEKIIEMFIILIAGVLAYKTGLIDKNSTAKLSNLLLMLISPLLIFQSYQMDFDTKLLYGLLFTLLASAISFICCIILSKFVIKGDDEKSPVEKIAVIYSNCAFIGIPLINGILGSEGVFYMTTYTTVFNILFWTHGVWVMSGDRNLKGIWKNLLTPAIVAVAIGLCFFIFQIRLPSIVSEPIQMIASMNTPLAMIIAGANLAQGNILKSFKNIRLYFISFLKLIIMPLVGLFVLKVMNLDFNVSFTVFIAIACPAGATTIMFAERYKKDAYYAAEIFMFTTVLSAITIPALTPLATWILK